MNVIGNIHCKNDKVLVHYRGKTIVWCIPFYL